MPNSMTGFSRQECVIAAGTLVWELRSVNHRYLETQIRLPDTLRELEPQIRDRLRQTLSRGKVEASLCYQAGAGNGPQPLQIDKALLGRLSATLAEITQELPTAAPVNPVDILRWPNLLICQQLDREQLLAEALRLFDQTLSAMVEHRQREGAELESLIGQRLEQVAVEVAKVRAQLPTILSMQRQKLLEKLEALSIEPDRDRLEQELVYLAQKSDVDEELDRLDTHVGEVRHTLRQTGSIGRRLDFLMQEMNREANTLSSKSIVSDTTQAAVELKVLIEQMREQIQNIE